MNNAEQLFEYLKKDNFNLFNKFKNNLDASDLSKIVFDEKYDFSTISLSLFNNNYDWIGITFKDQDFSKCKFENCHVLKNTTWIDCNFSGIKFTHCDFSGAEFINTDPNSDKFKDVEFFQCQFEQHDQKNTIFLTCNLVGIIWDKCEFQETEFKKCNLSQAEFTSEGRPQKPTLKAEFDNCKLNQTNFINYILDKSTWKNCNLQGGKFHQCTLNNVQFIEEDKTAYNFKEREFENCELKDVNFSYLNLDESIWTGCNFLDSKFNKCSLNQATFKDKKEVQLLKNVEFENCEVQNANFNKYNLDKSIWKNCNFKESEFIECKIHEATFEGDLTSEGFNDVIFKECDFYNNSIKNYNFKKSTWHGLHVNRSTFDNCNFDDAKFIANQNYSISSTFINCELNDTIWKEYQIISDANYSGCNLKNSKWINTKFNKATFKDAEFSHSLFYNITLDGNFLEEVKNISNCTFYELKIQGEKFKNINFEGCNFIQSNFNKCVLIKNTFKNTYFTGSKITDCTFNHSNIDNTYFDETTFSKFDLFETEINNNVVFSNSTFKDKIDFNAPKIKDILFYDSTFDGVFNMSGESIRILECIFNHHYYIKVPNDSIIWISGCVFNKTGIIEPLEKNIYKDHKNYLALKETHLIKGLRISNLSLYLENFYECDLKNVEFNSVNWLDTKYKKYEQTIKNHLKFENRYCEAVYKYHSLNKDYIKALTGILELLNQIELPDRELEHSLENWTDIKNKSIADYENSKKLLEYSNNQLNEFNQKELENKYLPFIKNNCKILRNYYLNQKDFETAEKFYLLDMNITQKIEESWFLKSLYWIYGTFTAYGSSPERIMRSFLGGLILVTIFYAFLFGYQFSFDFTPNNLNNAKHFLCMSIQNLFSFNLFEFNNQTNCSITMPIINNLQDLFIDFLIILLAIIQKVVGIPLIALFFLSVRRKIKFG